MLPVLYFLLALVHATCSSPTSFDYVIVGGGPAGLVLANRLSEDPSITVAVVEAGDTQYNNPNVTTVPDSVLGFGLGLNTSIDWSYVSAPQKYTLNRMHMYYSGKGLGGTTLINGMTYLRAEKTQIDAWEEMGNEGWNWDSLFEYYRGQEHFQPPDAGEVANGASFEEQDHGFEGELAVGWSEYLIGQDMFSILKETNEAIGIPWNKDANGGRMRGFTTWPFTLNASTTTREDAARAFYYSVAKQRPNLHVFVNATATRILWDEHTHTGEKLTAKAIEVLTPTNSTTATLHTTRELILAAGSLRSPALLEHSGIGNPAILEPLDIKPMLNLPSVGANMQDQPTTLISYASPTNWTGYPSFVSYLTASDLFGPELPSITAEIRANISAYAEKIVADAPVGSTSVETEEGLLKLQTNLVFAENSTVPLAELLWFPAPGSINVNYWTLLPFSRGSVHITSPNPTVQPTINPNFFQLPIDMYIQAAAAKKVRQFFSTTPLSTHITTEAVPGFATVPESAGWRDREWEAWIKTAYGANYHPVSSTAMRGRSWGGVVDKEGRVFGVGNVRVVDAGVLPAQISGHLSASVYAVAGKIVEGMLGAGNVVRR
ncbi:GMC oxidoreductase [Trematosphaeria pertusa]|uniref:GMC oxidoreductase n=1 Tax=Trematosphaeria pertusa TaxID=390896 RepID=A0A6A6I6P2_9PLEO|nr:GMC oxidoreductase [Trematosphaeria pertusa]KAF2246195.1 GMC oxidoreductase [Trematosphaeria pertusa]